VTVGGETLDEVCFRHYGTERGTFDVVLAKNRHVAELSPVLPEGVKIELPDLMETTSRREVKLWE